MKKIIELLESIKFWTIIGVIASGLILYLSIADSALKSSINVTICGQTVKDLKEDECVVLFNVLLFDENYDCFKVLAPIDVSLANTSTNVVENPYIRLYYTKEKYTSRLKDISTLYSYNDGEYTPFQSGDANWLKGVVEPKTAVISEIDGGKGNQFVCPIILESKYLKKNCRDLNVPELELDVVVGADDCVERKVRVKLVNLGIGYDGTNFENLENVGEIMDEIMNSDKSIVQKYIWVSVPDVKKYMIEEEAFLATERIMLE